MSKIVVQQGRGLPSLDEATPTDFESLGLPDLRHIESGLRPFSYTPIMLGKCPVPPDYYSHVAEVCQRLGIEYRRPDLDPDITIQPYQRPQPQPKTHTTKAVAVEATPATEENEVERLRRELREARAEINSLTQENAALKHELDYQHEWGSPTITMTQDGVFIARETLLQLAMLGLDAKQSPRTAVPLFCYILSQADASGLAQLEATAVSRDLLKLEHRRSWANLLGPIFGTLVAREGHHLRLNVTSHRYTMAASNPPPLQGDAPTATASNATPLQGEKLSPPTVTIPENVTAGGHNSDVMMNGDDIHNSSSLGGYHQSTPLPRDTQRRLDERQRQLHALHFNRDVAQRFEWAITYAPDATWASWLEQAQRGKNPAGLMCDKIKAYQERNGNKVIDLRQRTG